MLRIKNELERRSECLDMQCLQKNKAEETKDNSSRIKLRHYTKNEKIHYNGGKTEMDKNLRETARAYEPTKTKNIADLEAVSLDVKIQERKGTNKDGEDFNYYVAIVLGEEYRVPASVLKDINAIMIAKPGLKTIRVIKKGQGMSTSYTVIPLE